MKIILAYLIGLVMGFALATSVCGITYIVLQPKKADPSLWVPLNPPEEEHMHIPHVDNELNQ